MIRLDPYLLFNGDCGDAMIFYQACLGGNLTMSRVGESPVRDQLPREQHHKIIHATLHSESIRLSASDWLHPTRVPTRGNTTCLYLNGGTYEDLKMRFDKLAAGADERLIDPLMEMFFGTYGALTDKYGVRWMFQGEGRAR
jgi:PhnB protein